MTNRHAYKPIPEHLVEPSKVMFRGMLVCLIKIFEDPDLFDTLVRRNDLVGPLAEAVERIEEALSVDD